MLGNEVSCIIVGGRIVPVLVEVRAVYVSSVCVVLVHSVRHVWFSKCLIQFFGGTSALVLFRNHHLRSKHPDVINIVLWLSQVPSVANEEAKPRNLVGSLLLCSYFYFYFVPFSRGLLNYGLTIVIAYCE